MARFGLDYTGRISAASHRAVGSSFACRYLSTAGNPKNLQLAEARALRAGGIDIVTVFETYANRALSGEAAGVADAHAAESQARALGIPAGRPIFFAVDFDEAPGQTAVMDAYFKGVASVLGVERTGVYGDFYVIERVVGTGLAKYGWQTYAWSGGQISKHACLLQYSNNHVVAGVGVDYNRALAADFGQWGYVAPKPAVPNPIGVWHFHGTWDANRDFWTINGDPGENVHMGGHPLLHVAKVAVDERNGNWQIHKQPDEKA